MTHEEREYHYDERHFNHVVCTCRNFSFLSHNLCKFSILSSRLCTVQHICHVHSTTRVHIQHWERIWTESERKAAQVNKWWRHIQAIEPHSCSIFRMDIHQRPARPDDSITAWFSLGSGMVKQPRESPNSLELGSRGVTFSLPAYPSLTKLHTYMYLHMAVWKLMSTLYVHNL